MRNPFSGKFTLLTAECLGSCGTAPMMQVDETYYENLTEKKIDRTWVELAEGMDNGWRSHSLTATQTPRRQ